MSIKVAIVTGSRAEYGLLNPLIKRLKSDVFFETHLVVTGMHLSQKHGYTKDRILEDGIEISCEIDMNQSGDTPNDICKAIAEGLNGFSEHFSQNNYDVLIVLGDRFELWSACMAAVMHRIPIAHIHGGEATAGAIDEVIRHSITKMAALHFPSIKEYANRIVQMGERIDRVFTVGALGIENIISIEKMPIKELNDFTGVNFAKEEIALMTYHPVTTDDYHQAGEQINEILEALMETNLKTLVTMPNADAGGNIVYEAILKYADKWPQKFVFIKNMGQKAYISAMNCARLMIGNSSSGIIEAAWFKLPVVNIGDRQAGRYRTKNIIDCTCKKEDILRSIDIAMSLDFKEYLKDIENPYGDGKTAERIASVLKSINFNDKETLLKKEFKTLK